MANSERAFVGIEPGMGPRPTLSWSFHTDSGNGNGTRKEHIEINIYQGNVHKWLGTPLVSFLVPVPLTLQCKNFNTVYRKPFPLAPVLFLIWYHSSFVQIIHWCHCLQILTFYEIYVKIKCFRHVFATILFIFTSQSVYPQAGVSQSPGSFPGLWSHVLFKGVPQFWHGNTPVLAGGTPVPAWGGYHRTGVPLSHYRTGVPPGQNCDTFPARTGVILPWVLAIRQAVCLLQSFRRTLFLLNFCFFSKWFAGGPGFLNFDVHCSQYTKWS